MRIVHVVENLDRGGLEVMVITLVHAQIAQGHQCALICIFDEGELAGQLKNANIAVLTCHKKQGFDLNTIKKVKRHLCDFKPDVIHTHNPLAHYYTVFAARKLGIKKIINTRHGMGRDPFSARRELLFRLAMRHSEYTACVCQTALKRFIRLHMVPKKKTLVINNGISFNDRPTKSYEKKQALLKTCNLEGEFQIIGTVGRLEPIKNHAMLLKAFTLINQHNPKTILVIIGDGNESTALKTLAAENGISQSVRFLGARTNVAELIAGFDLFVMASKSEGYSMALLEAGAAGLPIVVTDVGGNHEIVQHNVTGRLISINDVHEMANAVCELLADEAQMQKMGTAGRSWVEKNATIEIMAQRYQQLYESK